MGVQITHQNANGTDAQVETIRCAANGNVIYLASEPSIPVVPGDFWAYGTIENITEDLVLQGKTPNDSPQLSATLTLTPYAPAVFEAETRTVPDYVPIMSIVNFKPGEILTPSDMGDQYKPVVVIDNGLCFYDFSTENFKESGLINFGGAKQFCDAEFVRDGVVSTYDNERGVMWARSSNGGYFKHLSETALYNFFSLTFFLRGDVETIANKQTIFSYADAENNYHFELYVENSILKVEYNNAKYNLPASANPKAGKHYAFVRKETEILIYIDGKLHEHAIPIVATFDDEGGFNDAREFDDEQDFSVQNVIDDESIFLKEVVGQSNTVYLNWLASQDGSNVATDLQIAHVRIFAWPIDSGFVGRLKNLGLPEILNTSVPKYFGENTLFPTTALPYDWIKYIGHEPFVRNGQYYRKNAGNVWELYISGT